MMKRTYWIITLLLLATTSLSACNVANTRPFGTPIPKLPMATAVEPKFDAALLPAGQCNVHAADLIGAWVKAGKSESEAFPFTATDGSTCQGSFQADILPLFTEPNTWYAGAPSCNSCHGPDVAYSWAQMSLGSYQDILAGSRRASAEATGNDILGPEWEKSVLYNQLAILRMPPGLPAGASPLGPEVVAGTK